MTPGWICKLDGKDHGPLSFAELKQLATEGRLTPQSEVRRSSDQRWFQAAQIAGLYPPAAADPPPAASSKPASIKRAKPLVAPPAAPAAVPGGVPVGIAVPPPAAPPPLPPPVATGAAAGLAFVPQIVTQPAARPAKSVKPAEPPADVMPGRKPDRSLLVVAGLSGTCVAVAVLGGVLLYLNAKRSPQAEEPDVAVAVAPEAEGEANPVVRKETNPTAPIAAASDSASSSTPVKAVADPQLARIRGIAQWSDLHVPHQFRSRSTQVTIVGAWLAADESGRRVAVKAAPAALPVAAPSVDAAPSAAAPAASPTLVAAEPAKYLFVEVKIANLSSKVLNYQGWNAADEDGAILADSDEVLPLVPLAATPAPGRLAARGIPAGGTVDDVLVFAAPQALTEKLRLALPQATLLSNARGYCAVEIDPQMLLLPAASGETRRPEDDLRLQIERDTARLEQEAAPPAPAADGKAAATPPAAERKKSDQPPTIVELNQAIEEAAKKAEGAKPAEAGKMNEPEETTKTKEPKS